MSRNARRLATSQRAESKAESCRRCKYYMHVSGKMGKCRLNEAVVEVKRFHTCRQQETMPVVIFLQAERVRTTRGTTIGKSHQAK